MKTDTIRGLAFDVIIEEFEVQDLSGRVLCYVASIYRQTPNVRELIRPSRLPETAAAIRREVARDGSGRFVSLPSEPTFQY